MRTDADEFDEKVAAYLRNHQGILDCRAGDVRTAMSLPEDQLGPRGKRIVAAFRLLASQWLDDSQMHD